MRPFREWSGEESNLSVIENRKNYHPITPFMQPIYHKLTALDIIKTMTTI